MDLSALTERLNHLQDRLDLALVAGGIGIWDWNIKAGTLEWDLRMFELFETNPLTWAGTYDAFAALVLPEDLPRVNRAVERSIADGVPYQYVFRLHANPAKTIRGKGKVFYDRATGDAVRFVGVCLEVEAGNGHGCAACINLVSDRI